MFVKDFWHGYEEFLWSFQPFSTTDNSPIVNCYNGNGYRAERKLDLSKFVYSECEDAFVCKTGEIFPDTAIAFATKYGKNTPKYNEMVQKLLKNTSCVSFEHFTLCCTCWACSGNTYSTRIKTSCLYTPNKSHLPGECRCKECVCPMRKTYMPLLFSKLFDLWPSINSNTQINFLQIILDYADLQLYSQKISLLPNFDGFIP